MIKFTDVSKTYSDTVALSNINLELPRGEIVGLFGENGAGKTTLMKSIFKFIRYEGTITLDGEPINHHNIAKISFATSEHSFFPALSPNAHRDFYSEHFPTFSDKRFTGLMDFFKLPYKKPLRSFSTGQKNQFEVILALSQGADFIIMDEPFSGNDMFNREDFYKVLLGILSPRETVLLSTHLIDEVSSFIGRALLLHKGELIGDTSVTDLDDQGIDLVSYVKTSYNYHSDRVSRALSVLTDEGDI